jgi:FKBP-type peptidyl-prolyl cis-trans isomerase SlpA
MNKLKIMFYSALLVLALSSAAFAKGEKIGPGKTVTIQYTTKINGQIVENPAKPVTFVIGNGSIIPGFEKKLTGLKKGDEKQITLTPQEGYGLEIKDAIQTFPKASFKDTVLTKGAIIKVKSSDNKTYPAVVNDVTDDKVVLNFNHPYAGKTLQIDVKVVDIK